MIILGPFVFILFILAIIYDYNKLQDEEVLEEWELPIINHSNLFEYNGKTWEHIYGHRSGFKLRVFNDNMTDFEFKDKIE